MKSEIQMSRILLMAAINKQRRLNENASNVEFSKFLATSGSFILSGSFTKN